MDEIGCLQFGYMPGEGQVRPMRRVLGVDLSA